VLGRRFPTAQAHIFLRLDFEQVPDAASRIHLATEPDALGVPKLRVEWRRSEEEARAAHLFAGPFDAFCRAQGLELNWEPGLLDDAAEWMKIGKDIFHPMGGARMGVSPANSVVNADLRLHEAPNGYVASCAVYPTGGSSNPTFTLMALCLRLADHLNAQLGRGL
jgi:choline dehydrogenase-like flavoprotein